MFVYGLDDLRILSVNDAAVKNYGYDGEQVLRMSLLDIHHPDESFELGHLGGDPSEDHAGRTWKHRKADGTTIDVAIFLSHLTYEGQRAMLIASIDITERKAAESRVVYMAHHDALTALPNRILLRQRMEGMISDLRRSGRGFAVFCVDLDNFKWVNDTPSHPFGDLLLQSVAARLRTEQRDQDTVARLGGDEFAILQADVGRPDEVSNLLARLLAIINEPYDLEGHQVTVGASIGVALAPNDGEDPDRLLKNADMALYRAKADGKGGFRFFESEMDARVQGRRRLEMYLRVAIKDEACEVHYQPLVSLASGEARSLEALIRWLHVQRGMIPPSDFIPVAEETGLIAPIGLFVLRWAYADAAQWPEDVNVAVNLSPMQFKSGNLLQTVHDALKDVGLPPMRLELEITETLLLDKSELVTATLHALRALGVYIPMDDFSTGYSSLSYLRSFPFDKIKIDRSFVHDIGANTDLQAIVRAIVSLGSSLGIKITAEGVETESDLAYPKAEGCTEGQGYLFSKAQPQASILALLAKQRGKRAAA